MPPIIAEDLGAIDDAVRGFLDYCGFPGLKVLQFAFDERNSDYLPHNYPRNSVVYTCLLYTSSASRLDRIMIRQPAA